MKSHTPLLRRLPLALLAALAACTGDKEPIVLGLAGPLTRANGESMKLAAEMAVAEINASGGIDGRDLVLRQEDDEASDQKAIGIARDLRGDARVVAVIGHVNSAVSVKAAPVYNLATGAADSIPGDPVLQISPASSAPSLSNAGDWTFRVCPTDLEFSPALAAWARGLGRSRAAVVYANDDYGRGVATTFLSAFRGAGGAVVSSDPYLPDQLKDPQALDAYLARAMRRNADALVIGGQAEAGLAIISAARRLGYTGPILGADGLTSIKDGGSIAEGVYITSAFLPDRNEDAARRFVSEYQRRYQKLPDHRGAMTYDIVYMLARALREVGTDRRDLRDYVARIGTGSDRATAPYEGVSGRIAFNEDGDVVQKPIAIGVVRSGRLVTATR